VKNYTKSDTAGVIAQVAAAYHETDPYTIFKKENKSLLDKDFAAKLYNLHNMNPLSAFCL
jgi:hypothetical protein